MNTVQTKKLTFIVVLSSCPVWIVEAITIAAARAEAQKWMNRYGLGLEFKVVAK